jgi:hypothetical protein
MKGPVRAMSPGEACLRGLLVTAFAAMVKERS